MLSKFGRVPTDDNVIAWNTGGCQVFGHAVACAIIMNPNLTITDVNVNDRSMNSPGALPSNVEHLVMVTLLVKDRFDFNVANGGLKLCVVLDHPLDGGAVPG